MGIMQPGLSLTILRARPRFIPASWAVTAMALLLLALAAARRHAAGGRVAAGGVAAGSPYARHAASSPVAQALPSLRGVVPGCAGICSWALTRRRLCAPF